MSTPTFSVADIRKTFLDFYASKGHTVVASSSLVPGNDPTLMFTNSGMVQFKDVFLGTDKRPYNRATSVQACLRAGGKHNDLENVGYTARHHTFFEMLGNWSFGDYFKKESIEWGWELLTKVFGLPAEKLLATVYHEDDEAYDIWKNVIGLPAERIIRIGDNKGGKYKSDNFWMMADTGPCGPCSEIFYDHGEHIAGGPPGSPEEDGDRFIEIWNHVFMQFDMKEDGSVVKLPAPCVDTGMGLERLAAILQHVHSNYEIDLFQALIKAAGRETRTEDLSTPSLKVIADHIRATSFLVSDGVIPSNEGRGYVQRRIIRRAIRHGYKLGQKTPFFHKLVADLVVQMGDAYPKLKEQEAHITSVLKAEEERFFETLANGMEILDSALAGDVKVLPGDVAFKLHDTYGFPLDLSNDVARERGVTVDEAGFNAAMQHQKETARAAGKFKMDRALEYTGDANVFTGYDKLAEAARIVALYADGVSVNELQAGQNGVVVLDTTPFYAESGGQVGDQGVIAAGGNRFAVEDTLKIKADVFGHHGVLEAGSLKVGDAVEAQVDTAVRAATMRNHSVTHIMHKALREVLGGHVQQKGSLVNAERTRFDFAHNAPVTAEQIREIEARVNAEVLANTATDARVMDIESAQKTGAMMLFGEKYGETVRVLDIGSSRELCGGTHVSRTGDIGLFKVVGESGVAAGVRRIEGITGENALAYLQSLESTVDQAAAAFKAPAAELTNRIGGALDQIKALEKEIAALKGKLASSQGDELATQAADVNGVKVLAAKLEGADAKTLRDTMDKLKDKLGAAVIVLAAVDGDKVQLAAGVTKAETAKVKAGELVNFVAQQVGGKGGGKPDMAMAGGTDAAAVPAALASVQAWVAERL
ncbi:MULTISPECIES: alanine--tRNA ligase [Comamonas]|uniref:Alanine--tRNA ligase n=1 Tax=Comamonas thiooxydans TaxID=363952 RepID=A0A096GCV1_9BURK|nr:MULTISPECIES: alanine--tRNA ligase [Comamonas]KGG92389.1 alanyl-tRNA synthetase [Comamonas thiooxydans]KGG93649.1 alanyl-tRNA synthetase [Comamonas thiooxydans]KGG98893.1 alanyl-tRNA synthetase [Comamonas thiooxydans]KGH05217.1 alanyl-tRNA synthetase [Comamonas thiooxydans]KGH14347.1 alanyl-tRNA synthetase [Comamonas thiooxydans]